MNYKNGDPVRIGDSVVYERNGVMREGIVLEVWNDRVLKLSGDEMLSGEDLGCFLTKKKEGVL